MTVITLRYDGYRGGNNYEGKDHIGNRFIATLIFGRVDPADRFLANCRGTPWLHKRIRMDVLETCSDHRELVKAKQVMTIEEWVEPGNALALTVQDNAIKYPTLVSPKIL